jgi:hypothetical protein
MSLKSVQFIHPNGSPFALVHEASAAFALWKEHRWDFIVGGQKYARNDWRGRCAIETLFGELYKLEEKENV